MHFPEAISQPIRHQWQAHRTCSPTVTQLTAYNGSATYPNLAPMTLPLSGGPAPSGPPRHVHTQWYRADTSGPAILGLPSSSKLGVMQLNCAIQFMHVNKKTHPTCKEDQPLSMRKSQVTCHTKLKTSSAVQMITPSSTQLQQGPHCCLPQSLWRNWMHFPRMYTIHLHMMMQNLSSMSPHKCPIAMCPLMHEKLDEFLEQEIIVPVTEPTDWVS